MNATARAKRKARQQRKIEGDRKTISGLQFIKTKHHAKHDGKSLRKWNRGHNYERGERFEVEPSTLGFMDANMREHRGAVRITDRLATWIRR